MKKALILSALVIFGIGFNADALAYEPYEAGFWTNIKSAGSDAQNVRLGSKVGRATCKNYVGVVKLGDCSLKAAMRNGRISKVNASDWEKKWMLIYGTKTLIVYGD